MSPKWTAAQSAAFDVKNKTLLLSAAAGSGKTTTLTERIIRALTDKQAPADISKMLIVTFTRASAADLKAKIYNALSDALANDPQSTYLSNQLIKLGSAKISTIDSFYLGAVRQNFSTLGLSSSFRIADESETSLISKNCITDVINRFYDTDPDFSSLCECFEKLRDTEGVVEQVLLDLYVDCMRTPEGVGYLKKCAEQTRFSRELPFLDTAYGRLIADYARLFFSEYFEEYTRLYGQILLDEHLSRAYGDAFESDRAMMLDALNLLDGKVEGGYTALCRLLSSYSMPALRSIGKHATDLSVYCKAVRDTFKEAFTVLRDEYFCYSQEDMLRFFDATAKNLDTLFRVLSQFERDYSDEKKRRNILELTDVKRYALKLFADDYGQPTALAVEYSQQFSDIYIDEYQDVDPVQDLIFRCIATPTNRFMVGDIKQSIYSFRGAEPQLFADYRAAFPTHGTSEASDSVSETIFMSENFRCAQPVIRFTNAVCADIFRACGPSIGYTDEDDLVYKKCADGTPEPKVSVALFAKNAKANIPDDVDVSALPSPAEAEAKYIANEIHRLIIGEKKQDGSPIKPCDIAVLFRSKSTAKRIREELSALGIRSTESDSTHYFQNPDVMMMLCILNAVDNPQRDVHLAGAMRSPIFGFTLDDLLRINLCGTSADSLYDKVCTCAEQDCELGMRAKEFLDTLDAWRSISASLPIDKFLSRIFASDAFVASGLVCEKNELGEGGNLQRLYEYARTFENGSFKGLYNFIEFINNIIESGKTLEVSSDTSESCVTLTTIHKSKGLEFPVCFVCNTAAAFGSNDGRSNLSFEYGTGVAMTLADSTGFAYYVSPLKKILDLHSDFKGVEEEMRILYVALTRAKERLYVSGSYSRSVMPTVLASARFKNRFYNRYSILSANCYLDWILPKALADADVCQCQLSAYTTELLPDVSVSAVPEREALPSAEFNSELYGKLRDDFAFEYEFSALHKIPAKISVSRLSPDVLDQSDVSVDLFDTERKPTVPAFFLSAQKTASAAERGTATHLFLQFCDFSQLARDGVDECLATLVSKRFIPQAIADMVYADELEAFRQSSLMREILSAEKVIREQRFNILLPASELSQDESFKRLSGAQTVAVQGVIDLILVAKNGSIRLYDYKTDRLSRAELDSATLAKDKLNSLHALQLSYYARAVEALFSKQPTRVAIYSTHAHESFDISVCALDIPSGSH